MSEVIREYSDGTKLIFKQGDFDRFQVAFLGRPPLGLATVPKDSQFLERFLTFDSTVVWSEALNLSKQAKIIRFDFENVVYLHKYSLEEQKIWDAYFACMIAEENKRNTKLGAKIKLLGLYQLLNEGLTPLEAANFSYGRENNFLLRLCVERGF